MTTNELIEVYGIGYNCLSDAFDLGYSTGANDMESAKAILVDAVTECMTAYKGKLFDLIYKIDVLTSCGDIHELRKLHHQNIDWIKESELMNDYYDYFIQKMKE